RPSLHAAAAGPHHRQEVRLHRGHRLPVLGAHRTHQGHRHGGTLMHIYVFF
ncbi:hypothetical protein CEXT_752751, partial [Caerostris extrusa]